MDTRETKISRLPELEEVPKQMVFFEIVTLLSLGVAVLALVLFAWIGDSVSHEKTRHFDSAVRMQVHQYASPWMTKAMIAVSFLGQEGLAIAAIVALVVFLRLRWRRAALWLVTTIFGALVLDVTLKYAFHRPRPDPFFAPLPHTYSFPSGHALVSFCFYAVLAGLLARRTSSITLRILIWICAILLVIAVGLSRIYLGVHYLSDVIAGYLAATIWVCAMIVLDRLRKKRKQDLQ